MREVFLIVDGRSVFDPCYHASKAEDRRSDSGVPVGALTGYHGQLVDVLKRVRPTRVLVAFDHEDGSNYRRSIMEGYKANRPPKPLDHLAQIDLAVRLSRAMGCYLVQTPEAEADDVIATSTRRAPAEWHVTIVTQDKDLTQLLGRPLTSILWRKAGAWAELGQDGARHRLGVEASQVVDYQALCGDDADSVPGCPGIGDKTARLLLETYGSLENIYAHIGCLKLPTGAKRIARLLHENKAAVHRAAAVVRLRGDLEGCGLPPTRGALAWSWASLDYEALDRLAAETALPWIAKDPTLG